MTIALSMVFMGVLALAFITHAQLSSHGLVGVLYRIAAWFCARDVVPYGKS
jgi:hypothetical protein